MLFGKTGIVRKVRKKITCLLANIFSIHRDMFYYQVYCFKRPVWKFSSLCFTRKKHLIDYLEFLHTQHQDTKTTFVAEAADSIKLHEEDPKVIAFYLPQFYHFEENDKWHGKGFTEWTNATKALPIFAGHYQPHLPYDVGFYNLDDTKVMHRQVELAQKYGISGFSFYYYWFSGMSFMDKPLRNYLADKSLDFSFCLTWACDNWSKRWDGTTTELLIASELRDGDAEKFFDDILPIVSDKRYIRINGNPLLQIYLVTQFENDIYQRFVAELQSFAQQHGFQFYISIVLSSDILSQYNVKSIEPEQWQAEAFTEFVPAGFNVKNTPKKKIKGFKNPLFVGRVHDLEPFFEKKFYKQNTLDVKYFMGICPSWDNTPRKLRTWGQVFYGITNERYTEWLKFCLKYTREHRELGERFVFINAWNEWGEGTHLEPDMRYGYMSLQATRDALENYSDTEL